MLFGKNSLPCWCAFHCLACSSIPCRRRAYPIEGCFWYIISRSANISSRYRPWLFWQQSNAFTRRHYDVNLDWECFLLNLIISNLLAFVHLLFFFYFSCLSSGPASYNNDEKTRLTYVLEHQPTSRRGYTCNARTEKREVFVPKVIESDDDRLLHLNSIHTETKEKFCILFHPFQ